MLNTFLDQPSDEPHAAWLSDLDVARLEFYARDESQGGASALSAWARDRNVRLGPIFDLNQTVSLLPVRFVPRGRFEFASNSCPSSRPAIVVEAKAEDDHTILDILAADVKQPTRLASMFSSVDILGLYAAYNPATYFKGKPLRVYRTIETWLCAGCNGSVLVDPDKAWRLLPSLLGPIGVEDLAHGREVLRLTEPFLAPERILVPVTQS
jgi:hypothetical protein